LPSMPNHKLCKSLSLRDPFGSSVDQHFMMLQTDRTVLI